MALRFEANKCPLHALQFLYSFSNIAHMFLQELMHFHTGGSLLMRKIRQPPYLVLAKAQFIAAQDEQQPFPVRRVVTSIARAISPIRIMLDPVVTIGSILLAGRWLRQQKTGSRVGFY